MAKTISESGISRRLRFRDLQVFFAVVQCGSMLKAATELGVTQPAVSEVIADLEDAFGVRLLDRSPRGRCQRSMVVRCSYAGSLPLMS